MMNALYKPTVILTIDVKMVSVGLKVVMFLQIVTVVKIIILIKCFAATDNAKNMTGSLCLHVKKLLTVLVML